MNRRIDLSFCGYRNHSLQRLIDKALHRFSQRCGLDERYAPGIDRELDPYVALGAHLFIDKAIDRRADEGFDRFTFGDMSPEGYVDPSSS